MATVCVIDLQGSFDHNGQASKRFWIAENLNEIITNTNKIIKASGVYNTIQYNTIQYNTVIALRCVISPTTQATSFSLSLDEYKQSLMYAPDTNEVTLLIDETFCNAIIDKTDYSPLGDTTTQESKDNFVNNLQDLVIVTWVHTHICVRHTVLDLLQHFSEKRVIVVSDATWSNDNVSHQEALNEMENSWATIRTTEQIIEMLKTNWDSENLNYNV